MTERNHGLQTEVSSQKDLLLKLQSEKEELEEKKQQLVVLFSVAVVLGLAGPVTRALVWVSAEAPTWQGYPQPRCM